MRTDPPPTPRPSLVSWDCVACRRPNCRHAGAGHGRRLFDAGELRLLILALLAEAPRHGYDIMKALAERIGGGYQPSPGVIYPTLAALEELGLAAASAGDDGRRLYKATAAGRQTLTANKEALRALQTRLSARTRCGVPTEVLAAMEELLGAVRERLGHGPAPAAATAAVAAILRAAAQAVRQK